MGVPESELQSSRTRGPNYIDTKNPKQIEKMRAACRLGREALDFAGRMVKPGVTGEEIDAAVHDFIVSRGGYPSPLNYYNFPKSLCVSVNEVICHGIPDDRPFADGDIVNLDVTVYLDGYHGDLNETFIVGTKATPDSIK
jgi:methionyl aminopeptidase